MSKKRIVNILLINRIFENVDLRNQTNITLGEFVEIRTKNNIEFDIKYLDTIPKNNNRTNCVYGFTIDENDINFKNVENHIITLVKDKDTSKYLIVNEPIDTYKMNKIYVKKQD